MTNLTPNPRPLGNLIDAAVAAFGNDMANAIDKGYVYDTNPDEPKAVQVVSTAIEIAGKRRHISIMISLIDVPATTTDEATP